MVFNTSCYYSHSQSMFFVPKIFSHLAKSSLGTEKLDYLKCMSSGDS